MFACLAAFLPWYSPAEVKPVIPHRSDLPSQQPREAVATARLIHEALLLKLEAVETQIETCRRRIAVIEAGFGMTQAELDLALARGSLRISADEAERWRAELERFESLREDRRRILSMIG
ncbi:MAG TPA: hypothetical protein VIV61_03870 [Candidatus Ozemobacteraceae bacterium]